MGIGLQSPFRWELIGKTGIFRPPQKNARGLDDRNFGTGE